MNTNKKSGRPERLYGTRADTTYTVSGIVHMIRNDAELPYVREGEIIVAERISAEWRDQLTLAKAIIESDSATDSVAALLGRHYDIPAIVSVSGAMELRSGDIVTVYGDGEIERIYEKRASDSPMRVSVPAAVAARTVHGIITAENVVSFSSARRRLESNDEDDGQSPVSTEGGSASSGPADGGSAAG